MANVVDLRVYRLDRYIESLEGGRPMHEDTAELLLKGLGVMGATYRKSDRESVYTLKLANGFAIKAKSAREELAWISCLKQLRLRLEDGCV